MRSGLLACVLALTCSSVGRAQPIGIPSLDMLVSQRPVQSDLQLQPAQIQELGQAANRQRSAMLQVLTLPMEQRSSRMTAVVLEGDKAIMLLLKPAQKQRMQQIHWQLHGCRAFANTEVIQELSLTNDQQFRINTVLDGFRGQANDLYNPSAANRPARPDNFRQQLAALDRPALVQIHLLLTGEQLARWKEALGKPYPTDLRLGR